MIWAEVKIYADAPERVIGRTASYGGVPLQDVDSVRYNVLEHMRRSRNSISLASPYLIPGEAGLEVFREVRSRGTKVSIITNSLASTDEPLVHTAYRRYRREMLSLGVELYEVSPRSVRRSISLGLFRSSIGRLHAKVAVFDARITYIGSMNLDPRSANLNTELGLFVESPEIAQQVQKLMTQLQRYGVYRLQLSSANQIEWIGTGPSGPILYSEPEIGLWDRAVLRLLAPFIPEGIL
jgi:putative cardiolipin synthase